MVIIMKPDATQEPVKRVAVLVESVELDVQLN